MISSDTPRPDATDPDTEYSLSIEDVADRYARSGHPRTARSVQRYCARGHLDCRKIETAFGDEYRVAPYSVGRHIAQIEELALTTSRDLTRPVATNVAQDSGADIPRTDNSTDRDQSRPDATPVAGELASDSDDRRRSDSLDMSRPVATESRYIEQLERDTEFLQGQIAVKDGQIRELTERARETNHLIAGLQKMLTPLLGSRRDQNGGGAEGDNRSEDHSTGL